MLYQLSHVRAGRNSPMRSGLYLIAAARSKGSGDRGWERTTATGRDRLSTATGASTATSAVGCQHGLGDRQRRRAHA
jgi:hypothetical protein